MSIYSGFATRNQQNYYDHIIFNIMSTLLVRLVKFYNNQNANQYKFHKILEKQLKILQKMEKRKYLQPKYAYLLQQFLNIYNQRERQKQKSQSCQDQQSIEPSILKNTQEIIQENKIRNQSLNRTFSLLDQQMKKLKQGAQKDLHKIQFKGDRQRSNNNSKQMYMEKIQNQKSKQLIQKSKRRLSKLEEYQFNPKQQLMGKKVGKSKSKSKSKKSHSYKGGLDLWQVRHQKAPQLPSLQPVQYGMLTRNNFNKNQVLIQKQKQKLNPKNEFSVRQDRTVFYDPIDNQFSMGNRTIYKTKNNFRSNMFYK